MYGGEQTHFVVSAVLQSQVTARWDGRRSLGLFGTGVVDVGCCSQRGCLVFVSVMTGHVTMVGERDKRESQPQEEKGKGKGGKMQKKGTRRKP